MKRKYNPSPKDYKRMDCPMTWDSKSIEKSADGALTIVGYANTKDRDRVGDIVEPKAFQKTLKQYMDNPVLLYMHDWDKVIGKIIHSEIDDKGLKVKAKISGAKDCEDIRTKIKEGILGTFSIGYNEIDADWDKESATNYVKELELLEISVVSIPANPEAKFTSAEETQEQESEDGEKSAIELVQELKTIIKEAKMTKKELEELKAKLRAKTAKEAEKTQEEEKDSDKTEEEKASEGEAQGEKEGNCDDEDKEDKEKSEESEEEDKEEEKMDDEGNSQDAEIDVAQVLASLAEKVDLLSEGMASMIEMFQMMTAEGKGDDMEDDKEEEEEKGDYSDEEEDDMDEEEKQLQELSDEEGIAVLEALSEELEGLED